MPAERLLADPRLAHRERDQRVPTARLFVGPREGVRDVKVFADLANITPKGCPRRCYRHG
jgi:hypothetical protein